MEPTEITVQHAPICFSMKYRSEAWCAPRIWCDASDKGCLTVKLRYSVASARAGSRKKCN